MRSVGLGSMTVTGGAGDLEGDVNGGSLSPALHELKNAPPRIPTAMIAGEMTPSQLAGLDNWELGKFLIRANCHSVLIPNLLANNLTSSGWPTIVGPSSDAVVPVNSQVNGNNTLSGTPLSAIHSAGMKALGFLGPTELERASTDVIKLLNTPVLASSVFIKQ